MANLSGRMILPPTVELQSGYDLYKDFLVPLGAAVIGGLLSLVAVWLVVSRSEAYRRLATWEPYAQELWNKQLDLCCDILSIANQAMDSAIYCFDVFNPNKDSQATYATALNEALASLSELKGKRLALCTPNFNQSVEMFTGQMIVIVQQFTAGKLNQKLSGNFPKLWSQLVDDTRSEVRVERLDAQAREAIEKSCTAPSFDPTGNSTLPY